MILRQFLQSDPVAVSYLLGCGGREPGAAVDPVGDIAPYLQAARALPDYPDVLRGAYSGSVCGRKLSGKPSSSIGFELRHNAAFRITDEAEFVRTMTAEIPPPPPGAARVRAINAGLAVPA